MARRREARHERDEAMRRRAEEQDRWAASGDPRGVYGPEGAPLMRNLSDSPPTGARRSPPGPDLAVAEIVHTEAELTALLAARLPSWRYAAFVSVLVQRRAAVQSRLRDARMGYLEAAEPSGPVLRTAAEAGLFFTERLGDLSDLIGQVDAFMLSAAFQEVFGDPHDGDSADAGGLLHAAHRLMDYHDRLLALSERCRAVRTPIDCRDLQRDFAVLTAVPLDGFTAFIDEFARRVDQMADVARYATGDVELEPVALSMDDDARVVERVSARLQQISRGR